MIAYLRGTVAAVTESSLVLEVNQVGYRVFVSARDSAAMPGRGEPVQVYTWMSVSQDAIRLYGFLDEDDLGIFKLLLNVSGVGPKAALGILSVLTANDLRLAILSDDVKTISRSPGIGAKTAKKVILELKDKLSLADVLEAGAVAGDHRLNGADAFPSAKEEALEALTALGYSNSDALRAVKKAPITEDMDTETILKLALKAMMS